MDTIWPLLTARIGHNFLHFSGAERTNAQSVHFDTRAHGLVCAFANTQRPVSRRTISVVAPLWFIV